MGSDQTTYNMGYVIKALRLTDLLELLPSPHNPTILERPLPVPVT